MNIPRLEENCKRYKCSFSPELQEIAKNELNEDPDKIPSFCIELYKKYCEKTDSKILKIYEEDLTNPEFLLRFLRVNKYNIDKAYKKLKVWINTLTGVEWPELAERLKDQNLLINFVKSRETYLIGDCIKSNVPDKYSPWVVLTANSHSTKIEDLNDYFLNVAALSVATLDYIYRKTESAQVLGMYNVSLINPQAESFTFRFLSNISLFRKMLKLWTETLCVRQNGQIQLNFKQSRIMALFETLVSPFLSDKLKARRKNYGPDWLNDACEGENSIFIREKLPKSIGGNKDESEILSWIEEYFDMISSV